MSSERPPKRRRRSGSSDDHDARSSSSSKEARGADVSGTALHDGSHVPHSLSRAISPPPGMALNRKISQQSESLEPTATSSQGQGNSKAGSGVSSMKPERVLTPIASPISLTRICDLPDSYNQDTVSLSDILGDPMIKEAWIFNYLFDVSFIMSHLDPDVRSNVKVKIVHGSWRREDSHRISVEADAKQYPNVQIMTAHMPETFGTHHSKAIFLIRHDDLAQVVIHTANMIPQDWRNLSQAVWRSPLLPLLSEPRDNTEGPIGSGARFRIDLLNYLRFYGSRTKALTDQLEQYNFSAIRAALVASVPCRQATNGLPPQQTYWGWNGLKRILSAVPTSDSSKAAQMVIQISSVGNLGTKDKWFDPFLRVLSTRSGSRELNKLNFVPNPKTTPLSAKPTFHIIFPTTEEVRRSLDGYASGASIHMKLENKAMQSQVEYMRPMLRHWAGSSRSDQDQTEKDSPPTREAMRRRAAPHIKTYIRFSDAAMDRIEWAMLTSANMSKQAWGDAAKNGEDGREIRIASYELGIVVWPAVFEDRVEGDASVETVMVPTFGKNMPEAADLDDMDSARLERTKLVGFRMPYDLPLVPYTSKELPWCATATHTEPDSKGVTWQGFVGRR